VSAGDLYNKTPMLRMVATTLSLCKSNKGEEDTDRTGKHIANILQSITKALVMVDSLRSLKDIVAMPKSTPTIIQSHLWPSDVPMGEHGMP
jgi:hypothetical protein